MAKQRKVQAQFGRCECGCGQRVGSSKARFVQGHDMKLKSRVKEALRGGKRQREWALRTLEQYGWRGQVVVPDKPADAR